MARITIEDCLARIPNRFELTLAATNRARQISAGSAPLVDSDRDKPTVIALREAAPSVPVLVGGAVVTADWAAALGAGYSADAPGCVEAVRAAVAGKGV